MSIGQLIFVVIVGVPYLLGIIYTIKDVIGTYKWCKRSNRKFGLGEALYQLDNVGIITVCYTLTIIIVTIIQLIVTYWSTPL